MRCGNAPRVGLAAKPAAWYFIMRFGYSLPVPLCFSSTTQQQAGIIAVLGAWPLQVMEILENLVSGRGAGDMRQIAVSSSASRLALTGELNSSYLI